jgi:serine-type D-Ala-D-Ala carboxypeptidase/endopeptidase (penicillin-binding protein 4)
VVVVGAGGRLMASPHSGRPTMAAMLQRHLARWASLLVLATGPTAVTAQAPLPPPVLQALAGAGLPADALAVAALPLAHAAPPWGVQMHRAMQPGSAMKVLTSIVVLDQIGPNHRGFTELTTAAALDGATATLKGDLVLRGGGDAELGVAQLWALLVDLRQAGVRTIEGDLIVDRTRYRPARFDLNLPPFDDAPEFPYNVIPDALHLAGSLLPLELRAADAGVVAATVPPLDGIVLRSAMALVDGRCADWDDHWKPALVERSADGTTTTVTLQGAFPRGCTTRAELQLIDRQELTERLFRTLWRGLGGSWAGRAREAASPAGARVLARRQGRPWGELLRQVNKASDNAWTRLLFLELGVPAMAAEPGRTTAQLADAEIRRWLRARRIDDTGLVTDNGSGLSRSERITPWQLASALQAAWHGRHAADLTMSLPTVGVDGTMRNRLKDSPATGWARLKTGTLRNVVALAGYVRDANGWPWAVAMIINHDERANRGRPVLDALVDHIAREGMPAAAPPLWSPPSGP